jgi:hypothetical protein
VAEAVEDIFRRIKRLGPRIKRLSRAQRDRLWALVEREYHLGLYQDGQKHIRPWHDARNRFGETPVRLLDFLFAKPAVSARTLIRRLWPAEVDAGGDRAGRRGNLVRLQARLRQLQKFVNEKLLKLRSPWQIVRPCNGYLHLQAGRRIV